MVIGVNGAGKTTTIAKLARVYQREGRAVLLGAGDTFRAAAIEQLSLWAERLSIPIIVHNRVTTHRQWVYDTIVSGGELKGVDYIPSLRFPGGEELTFPRKTLWEKKFPKELG